MRTQCLRQSLEVRVQKFKVFVCLYVLQFDYNIQGSIRSMEKEVLTAKNFLKNPLQRNKYECTICYEVCIKPVRCQGTCNNVFCMKCVSDTRNELDVCPCRCSSPFLVTPIPPFEVHFFCPYDPSNCPSDIASLKEFDEHYRICPFVSKEELELKRLRNEYKCLSNHHLEFYVGSYDQMVNSVCYECKDQKLCRSYCRICQHFYCVTCRIPPCSKEGCPIGHPFHFQRLANVNYICDICGVSTAVSNDGVYDDNICNFGLCQACYQQLPAKFDQSKPRAIIANINTQCACSHLLTMVDTVHHKNQCELCHKVKECPKQCPNCSKRYCLACKLFDIYNDSTCRNDHQIVPVQASTFASFIERESQFGCMRCGESKEEYYFDHECFVRLCKDCLYYSMRVTTDKERPISLTCDKNHVLAYVTGNELYYSQCFKCKKNKQIKLACLHCDEEERNYCFQCKQIPLRTCYFKHKLKPVTLEVNRECNLCQDRCKQLMHCPKCFFFACNNCVLLTLNGQTALTEENRLVQNSMQPEIEQMQQT